MIFVIGPSIFKFILKFWCLWGAKLIFFHRLNFTRRLKIYTYPLIGLYGVSLYFLIRETIGNLWTKISIFYQNIKYGLYNTALGEYFRFKTYIIHSGEVPFCWHLNFTKLMFTQIMLLYQVCYHLDLRPKPCRCPSSN